MCFLMAECIPLWGEDNLFCQYSLSPFFAFKLIHSSVKYFSGTCYMLGTPPSAEDIE